MNELLNEQADRALAVAQQVYNTTSVVIDFATTQGLALKHVYPHGYCAIASAEIDASALTCGLKELIFGKLKPLPLVHLFAAGNYSTVKPLACLTGQERAHHNIVPVFPVYYKTAKETTMRWWTQVGDQIVEFYMDPKSLSLAEVSRLFEELGPVTANSITYAQGSLSFLTLEPVPVPVKELPLMQLEAELRQSDSAWLNQAWAWRVDGGIAAQKSLDAIVKSDDTKNYWLSAERQAEVLRVQTALALKYVPLARETDVVLRRIADALTALFEEKGIPDLTPTTLEYIKHYVAKTLGVTLPILALKQASKNQWILELGIRRSWFAPLEVVIGLHNPATLRIQDLGLSWTAPTV